jgi:hypothetical protein
MNVIEAFKLLQDGKKIYHEITPYVIYQLIDQELKMYRQYDEYNHFVLLDIDMNIITIDCKRMMEGWNQRIEPVPITFNVAKIFYKNGKTIKRIGKGLIYNNTDLVQIPLSMEDIEANDWEIVEVIK